jgi:hypothetical protein
MVVLRQVVRKKKGAENAKTAWEGGFAGICSGSAVT